MSSSVGHARVAKDALQRFGAARHVLGVFDYRGVAGEEGRGEEADHLPEREIPRHHGKDRPDALEAHPGLARRRLDREGRQPARPELRRSAAGHRAFLDLAARLGDRLPHLRGDQPGERLDLCIETIGERHEQLGPPLDTQGRVTGRQARADVASSARSICARFVQRIGAERLAGRRVDRPEQRVRTLCGLVIDYSFPRRGCGCRRLPSQRNATAPSSRNAVGGTLLRIGIDFSPSISSSTPRPGASGGRKWPLTTGRIALTALVHGARSCT